MTGTLNFGISGPSTASGRSRMQVHLTPQPRLHHKHSSKISRRTARPRVTACCSTRTAAMSSGTSPAPVTAHSSTTGPFIAGLTGSIGMGKSAVSAMLQQLGVPVLCADEVVHRLYSQGGAAVGPVGAAFPSAIVNEAVDRPSLSRCVLGNESAMQRLEGLVHPLVEAERLRFVQQHAAAGSPLVVFDIPLLFETAAEGQCDAVLVVSAPPQAQQQRVLARPGMTQEKLAAILARQVPDADKRQRADFVIDTGCSLQETQQQVEELVQQLRVKTGGAAARLLKQAQEKQQ